MSPSYLVIYWNGDGASRRCAESHEFPKITAARRQLRERGYKRDSGTASLGEVEEYSRSGYDEKPAASITMIKAGIPTLQPMDA